MKRSNMFTPLVITVTYFWLSVSAQVAEITIPPKSVNVSLNGVAEFNCTAVAANFVWKKNGMDVNNGIGTVIKDTIVNEVQSIRKSMLKLTVSSVIDIASNITCTAVKNSPFSNDESEPAILLVQGLLKSVSNLTVTSINSTTVLISWSPPYTLEGIPILGYNVTITTSGGPNETMSVDGVISMLYYSIDLPDSVKNYTVTIVPINEVGIGESAETSTVLTPVVHITSSTPTGSVIMTPSTSVPPSGDNLVAVTVGVLLPVIVLVLVVYIVITLLIICTWHKRLHNASRAEPSAEAYKQKTVEDKRNELESYQPLQVPKRARTIHVTDSSRLKIDGTQPNSS